MFGTVAHNIPARTDPMGPPENEQPGDAVFIARLRGNRILQRPYTGEQNGKGRPIIFDKNNPFILQKEEYLGERFRLDTPVPREPKAMVKTIAEVVKHWDWKGPVGVGFPTVIHKGKAIEHGNLDKSWVGIQVDDMISQKIGLPVNVMNDADAAGLAEMEFGVGKGVEGLVIVVTVGTGIGSGVFYNGELIPNFELGQMRYKKKKIIFCVPTVTGKF